MISAIRALTSLDVLCQSHAAAAAVREDVEQGHVLVVEDDALIRNIIVEHLTTEGIAEPHVASSVAEARACIAAERPSLIMLDLMLPLESGWDFLRERRADPLLAPIPVMVLSAATQDLLRDAKHLGADALMSKPFDLDALTGVVRSFIG
jgi:two-component system, OmpR family, response regulator